MMHIFLVLSSPCMRHSLSAQQYATVFLEPVILRSIISRRIQLVKVVCVLVPMDFFAHGTSLMRE